MREIIIHLLLGVLGLQVGMLYCMLKKELKNKMNEK